MTRPTRRCAGLPALQRCSSDPDAASQDISTASPRMYASEPDTSPCGSCRNDCPWDDEEPPVATRCETFTRQMLQQMDVIMDAASVPRRSSLHVHSGGKMEATSKPRRAFRGGRLPASCAVKSSSHGNPRSLATVVALCEKLLS